MESDERTTIDDGYAADDPASDVEAAQPANDELEHTEGGVTTRSDRTDAGVPMLPGSPDEPQGPEDALGPGPKRGDYTDRIGPSGYEPHETKPVDAEPEERHVSRETGEEVSADADDAVAAPVDQPEVEIEAQRPRAEEIGDAEGDKGGVETA